MSAAFAARTWEPRTPPAAPPPPAEPLRELFAEKQSAEIAQSYSRGVARDRHR